MQTVNEQSSEPTGRSGSGVNLHLMTQPAAEIHITASTVRSLLAAECPELAELPVRMVDEGWDNFTFLAGQQYAVRLPRREAAVPLLLNEQRWLPVLAPRLPLAVPTPVYCGAPGELFPWPWSVVHWAPGVTAERHPFHSPDVRLLAETLLKLHEPAPDEAPINTFRGVPLSTKNEMVAERIDRFRRRPNVDAPIG